MTLKAIFSLFLLVTTLVVIYAKPFPNQIYLDQVSEDTTEDTLIFESNKQVGNFPETKEHLLIIHELDCPWPPALCGNGGDFGEPT